MTSGRTRWTAGVAMVTLLAGLVVGYLLLDVQAPSRPHPPRAETAARVEAEVEAGAERPAAMVVAPTATLRPAQRCDNVERGVVPTALEIPGVTGSAPVITPPRDARGVPGVPPLSAAGKHLVAWDTAQGTRPGDPAGNVLLNAHTWPDGSALGNHLLSGLHVGGAVIVIGEGRRLCYEVTERVEVLASQGFPRYYEVDGPPRLAILACSGRRLGPGNWEKRTVWFAAPVA